MRLDVAVDDAGGVGGVERFGDLAEQVEGAVRRQRPLAVEQRPQVAAGDQAHRHDQLAVDLARVVDGDDGGVVEPGGEPRLAQEALAEAVAVGELAGDHLQRHRPLEAEVGGAVDDPHPAAGEQLFDPVAGDLRADREFPHIRVISSDRARASGAPHGPREGRRSNSGRGDFPSPGPEAGGRTPAARFEEGSSRSA